MFKVGDRVQILTGNHKGKQGKVSEVTLCAVCCEIQSRWEDEESFHEWYDFKSIKLLEPPNQHSSRHPLDFYESPSWFTTELLRHVKIEGVIGEPCVGGGAIASLLQAWPHTKQIWTNDIDPDKQADYHLDAIAPQSWEQLPDADWIITNPPYAQNAAPIIKNAFEKARVGVVAFLLTSFLEPCDDRADFLKQHPPSLVLTLPRYCFRKDKKGVRWTTDNITISCFVWDKRATTQRLITRPISEILGFYKNPDCAISSSVAEGIVGAIAAGEITTNYQAMSADSWNPTDFGDVPYKADGSQLTIFYDDTNEPPDPDDYPNNISAYEQAWTEWEKRLTRANAIAGTCIVGPFESLGIIKNNLGFGFVVDWQGNDRISSESEMLKDVTYNWERDRDRDRINTFSIAPQSLISPIENTPIQESKIMTNATFQFSSTSVIAGQIAQLQEQLNALTATLKPYQECEQKAEELRRQVAEYGREMVNKAIPQEDILRWARSLYSAASGVEFVEGDNGVVAAQNQVIAELKTELANIEKREERALAQLAEGIALKNEAFLQLADARKDRDEALADVAKIIAHAKLLEGENLELKALSSQSDIATIEALREENMSLIAKVQALDLLTDDLDAQLAEQQLMPEVEVLNQQIFELRSRLEEKEVLHASCFKSGNPPNALAPESDKKSAVSEQIIDILKRHDSLSGNKIIQSLGLNDETGRGVYTELNRLVTKNVVSRSPDPLDKRRNVYALCLENNTQQITQHLENNTQQITQQLIEAT